MNGYIFVILIVLWEIAAILIIGVLFGYQEIFRNISLQLDFLTNTYVAIALLICVLSGFTLMSAYITKSAALNMTMCIVVFLLTLENWFIYRCFWNKVGLNLHDVGGNFKEPTPYREISLLPFGNDRQISDQYTSASVYEALGACIAMFAALTPLLGRIGFVELFFLTWIGPAFYELNDTLFNRFYIADQGFGMRGFLFGGILGLILTLIIGKKDISSSHPNFSSSYMTQAITFVGTVLVCLTFPNLICAGLITERIGNENITNGDMFVILSAQINAWFSMAGGVVGAFTASALVYKKFYLHDIIFTALAGAIAFSSSADVNWNPGAAMTIGSFAGFICSLCHTPFKSWMNKEGGVLTSNSVVIQFIIPGLFACIFSAILQSTG